MSKILNLPDHIRPVAIVPVGYPDEYPPSPGRIEGEHAIISRQGIFVLQNYGLRQNHTKIYL